MLGAAMGNASPSPASDHPAEPAGGGLNLGALASMLGNLGGGQAAQADSGLPPINMQTIMTIQKAMSTLKSDDKNISLMRALKPHFSAERAKKVDDAVRIMQLIKLLPLLKESGILGKLGGDLF